MEVESTDEEMTGAGNAASSSSAMESTDQKGWRKDLEEYKLSELIKLGNELNMTEAVTAILDSEDKVRVKLIDAIVIQKAILTNEETTADQESWKMIPNKRKIVPRGALSPGRKAGSGKQKGCGAKGSGGSEKRSRRGA